MFLGSKIDNNEVTFAIENNQIKCKKEVKLLGITIDKKLTFTKHIANICSLENHRLRALTIITRFLSTEQTKCFVLFLLYLKLILCQLLNTAL